MGARSGSYPRPPSGNSDANLALLVQQGIDDRLHIDGVIQCLTNPRIDEWLDIIRNADERNTGHRLRNDRRPAFFNGRGLIGRNWSE